MKIFQIVSRPFISFVERYYPDAFIFVIVLSVITFLAAISLTDASVTSTIVAWGDGLPMLFKFTAQITIIMVGAHALAHTSLVAWSFGLIIGAIVARSVAIECSKKPFKVHYPLLVASAYSGFVIWHMGYSSSTALFVATPGHLLESRVGVIPVTETILSSTNITLALMGLLLITVICPLMKPNE